MAEVLMQLNLLEVKDLEGVETEQLLGSTMSSTS